MKLSTAKKKAWKAFSEYIRRSHADANGYVSCVTCGTTRQWNDSMDAGHFIPKSRGNAVYFVVENVHPQCKRCNLMEGGNFENYYPYMLEMYGESGIEELRQLSKTQKHYTLNDYLDLYQEYKGKLDDL
ncbi:MAG: hypothetical protein HKP41_00395 [Desulfobacterales bacterium]|nr:hypothetical protein [Desulfobacterales bacterium]